MNTSINLMMHDCLLIFIAHFPLDRVCKDCYVDQPSDHSGKYINSGEFSSKSSVEDDEIDCSNEGEVKDEQQQQQEQTRTTEHVDDFFSSSKLDGLDVSSPSSSAKMSLCEQCQVAPTHHSQKRSCRTY